MSDHMTFDQQFNQWMTRMNEKEHPPKEIIAFNFGLFETIEGFTIYLIGAKNFDAQSDEWALEPDFEPKDEYLEINPDETAEMKPDDVLKMAAGVVVSYIDSESFPSSFLKNAQAITTGFDDGKLMRIK
jgi:hypothetical protein